MTGNDAKSAVASEITAMFENSVLPWIQSFYLHQDKSIEQLCMEYCTMRGWPLSDWVGIHIPASFVIDNDPRHAAMRQYIALPRVDLADKQREWVENERARQQKRDQARGDDVAAQHRPQKRRCLVSYQQRPRAYNLQFTDVALDRITDEAPAVYQEAKRRLEARRADEAVLDRFAEEHAGIDLYQTRVWVHAQADKRYLCVRPEQFAAHPAATPEMNCPAEHMVRTLKARIKALIIGAHCNHKILKVGRTYQAWIWEAVQQLANGAQGRWQIMRSIEKLSCIHEILAGEAGRAIDVQFIFNRWAPHRNADVVAQDPHVNRDYGRSGHPVFDAAKAKTHRVQCTGGHYIMHTGFT